MYLFDGCRQHAPHLALVLELEARELWGGERKEEGVLPVSRQLYNNYTTKFRLSKHSPSAVTFPSPSTSSARSLSSSRAALACAESASSWRPCRLPWQQETTHQQQVLYVSATTKTVASHTTSCTVTAASTYHQQPHLPQPTTLTLTLSNQVL